MRRTHAEYAQNKREISGEDPRSTQAKLLAMADRWADGDTDAIADTGDYRRVVQSVLDLARSADESAREIRVVLDGGAEGYTV